MSTLIPNSAIPLYKQLSEKIRVDHIYAKNRTENMIPSEKELIEQYGVSRITVRNAVNELVEEGYLQKIQGKGTFICERKVSFPMNHTGGFTQTCRIMGVTPSTKVLSIEPVVPPKSEREFFKLAKNEKILLVRRLRLCDDYPTVLENLYLPMKYAALTKEDLQGSFYSLLKERYDTTPQKGPKWVQITNATLEEADILKRTEGEPLILVHESAFKMDGTPIHSTRLLFGSPFRFYFS